MTTSRPVFSWPSTWTTMRSRSPLTSRVCCVSARPISHGMPACLSEVSGAAPGAAVVARDEDDVGVRLGHARRHRAHADLGHQLHVDPGRGVGRLEVVDQLGDVLDGVDVVVRRRRDEADAGRRVAGAGDPGPDLGARELTALAGLGPLGDLDLQVVRVDQVLAGHAEAPRRHLLDGRAPQVPVLVGREAVRRPRRPRRCWSARRGGSWRWPASRAPRPRWSRRTWRRWRSASRCRRPTRPRRSGRGRRRPGAGA